VNRPLPWLRYVDASSLNDEVVDFDGLNVESPTGEHLGDVEGFIVDTNSSRPYYVVVDTGGWFKSKHFLLPVGHTRFDPDEEVLVTELSRERIDRFPGFDKDNFETLSDEDWKRFNNETCQACTVTGVSVVYAANEPYAAAWDRADYSYPDWWQANPALPSRMGESAITAGAAYPPATSTATADRSNRDRAVARGTETTGQGQGQADPSPHFDGRAQPGDVIGVETEGERTYIGDTAEDENKRRQDAEEAVQRPKD
jgi:PRC-barrel domain